MVIFYGMWLKIISFLSAKQWTMVVLVIKLSLWGKAANKNRSSGSWRKTVSGLKKNPAATKRVISHQRLLEILYNNKNILFWRKQAYKRYVLYLMPQNICFTAIFIRGNSIVFRNKGPSLMEQNSMSVFYLQIISVVSNYCPAGGHFFFSSTFLKFSKQCKENNGLQTQPCERWENSGLCPVPRGPSRAAIVTLSGVLIYD